MVQPSVPRTSPLRQTLTDSTVRAAYRAQQAALRVPLVTAHLVLRRATRNRRSPEVEAARAMQRRYWDLLERDVENVEAGDYPRSLLFQIPIGDYARALPRFIGDIPRAYKRSRRKNHTDLPRDVALDRYPPYFRRTFHWQTDGYLSEHSAELYDVGVEFLFIGCADVMRRQVIPPIARFVRRMDAPAKILDVGCGTGRTLLQLAHAMPGHRYFGVDLSPFYVARSRRLLAEIPEVSLVAENAEHLPYRDAYFDVVTSTYLLHELPQNARHHVISEMHRVLRPGGLLVIEDSSQYSDAKDLAYFLDNFSAEMHEPFYPDYLRDDLATRLHHTGFTVTGEHPCWVAKVVTAKRPG